MLHSLRSISSRFFSAEQRKTTVNLSVVSGCAERACYNNPLHVGMNCFTPTHFLILQINITLHRTDQRFFECNVGGLS